MEPNEPTTGGGRGLAGIPHGVRVAYATVGRGLALLVPAVQYDRPGCGLSEPWPGRQTLGTEVEVLQAVADHLELDRLDLLGASMGAPVALAFAAAHPARVARLVIYGGYADGRRIATAEVRTARMQSELSALYYQYYRFACDTARKAEQATNDSGMFETNLRDKRFLPFEGAGAISTWNLSLPAQLRSFDYTTISDVVLHIRYTARQAGDPLEAQATKELTAMLDTAGQSGQAILFCLRYDFPTQWSAFVNANAAFTVTLDRQFFPYYVQNARKLTVDSLTLYGKLTGTCVRDPACRSSGTIGGTERCNRAGSAQSARGRHGHDSESAPASIPCAPIPLRSIIRIVVMDHSAFCQLTPRGKLRLMTTRRADSRGVTGPAWRQVLDGSLET